MEPCYIKPFEWSIAYKDGDGETDVINCWGLDRDQTPTLLRITGFPSICVLQLPTHVNNRPMNWNNATVSELYQLLSKALKNDKPYTYKYSTNFRLLYYYQPPGVVHHMVSLFFHNHDAMNHCRNLLRKPVSLGEWRYMTINVHEAEIDKIRKLMTARNLEYSDWIQFDGQAVPLSDQVSIKTCKEYTAVWTALNPTPKEESRSWVSNPSLVSWDIETYTPNHRAVPNRLKATDVVYMISVIYQRLGDKSSRKRYGIIIGDCPEIDLPNTVIIRVNDEIELINMFAKVIAECDPDLLIGYNVMGYDYPYIDFRLKQKCHTWAQASRLFGKTPDVKTMSWSSKAYGDQEMMYLDLDGRINIDLLPIIKRDFKLVRYTLDFVCKTILGRGKHDVSAIEMFKIYESKMCNPTDAQALADTKRVMAYCIEDSELVIDLFETINTWMDLVQKSNILGCRIIDVFTRGQQMKVFSQLYNIAAKNGIIVNRRNVASSQFEGGGAVKKPLTGVHDNIVCLDFNSLYPSIIIAYNICYTTLVPPELYDSVPDSDCNVIEFSVKTYYKIIKGKKVQIKVDDDDDDEEDDGDEPVESDPNIITETHHYRYKFYNKFQGILPQLVDNLIKQRKIVRKEGESHKSSSAKLRKILNEFDQLSDEAYNDFLKDYPNFKDMAREDVRDIVTSMTKDESLQTLTCDKRQLAIKVSANSMFGFLGVKDGVLPLMEAAMSVTAMGRQLIHLAGDYIEKKYKGVMVYGDTDSVMMDIGITDPTKANYWGKRLEIEINGVKAGEKDWDGNIVQEDMPGIFPHPLRIELEKVMRILCITKKKYAAYLVKKDGTLKTDDAGKKELLIRGIVLARRDFAAYLRNRYELLLRCCLDYRPIQEAFEIIYQAMDDLINYRVSLEDLAIVKGLGASYVGNYYMKVFADRMTALGKAVQAGDRLDFIVVDRPELPKKDAKTGNKMFLLEQLMSDSTYAHYKPDIEYYLNHIARAMDQLFAISYGKVLDKFTLQYRSSNRQKNATTFHTPVRLYINMRKAKEPLELLRNIFYQCLQQIQ